MKAAHFVLPGRQDHSWHPARYHRHLKKQGASLVFVSEEFLKISISILASDVHPREEVQRLHIMFDNSWNCWGRFSEDFDIFYWMASFGGFILYTNRSRTKLSSCIWHTLCARRFSWCLALTDPEYLLQMNSRSLPSHWPSIKHLWWMYCTHAVWSWCRESGSLYHETFQGVCQPLVLHATIHCRSAAVSYS